MCCAALCCGVLWCASWVYKIRLRNVVGSGVESLHHGWTEFRGHRRCEVQGSGFRVQGSGFRVQGSGFRVQGLGFRVQGCLMVGHGQSNERFEFTKYIGFLISA